MKVVSLIENMPVFSTSDATLKNSTASAQEDQMSNAAPQEEKKGFDTAAYGWGIITTVVLVILAIVIGVLLFGNPFDRFASAQNDAAVDEWFDEDGHAVVNDPTTPRFSTWVEQHIRESYPNATIQNFGSWIQATLPGGLIVSWAEWGNPLALGQVDGLYEGKSLFVAMRDYAPWVEDSAVQHVECSGTYIASYSASRMSNWDVHFSTILQFDGGNANEFVRGMTNAWNQVRLNLGGCPES